MEEEKYFVVETREVYIAGILVKAKDELEAKEKAYETGENLPYFEYSHTLDTDKWTVREPTEKELENKII